MRVTFPIFLSYQVSKDKESIKNMSNNKNKKAMKKYFTCFLAMMMALMMCMTISSCSKDDEIGSGSFSIVGTWYETEDDVEGLDAIWIFKSDNTGTVEEFYRGKSEGVFDFSYKFENSALTIYEKEKGVIEESVFNIKIVSDDEFTWSDGEDKLTFKRKK